MHAAHTPPARKIQQWMTSVRRSPQWAAVVRLLRWQGAVGGGDNQGPHQQTATSFKAFLVCARLEARIRRLVDVTNPAKTQNQNDDCDLCPAACSPHLDAMGGSCRVFRGREMAMSLPRLPAKPGCGQVTRRGSMTNSRIACHMGRKESIVKPGCPDTRERLKIDYSAVERCLQAPGPVCIADDSPLSRDTRGWRCKRTSQHSTHPPSIDLAWLHDGLPNLAGTGVWAGSTSFSTRAQNGRALIYCL